MCTGRAAPYTLKKQGFNPRGDAMRGKITVKDRVLLILEENKGSTISGEALAKALNVSRAAVWKAMKQLQEEGYEISASTNRGYCLDLNSDVLSMQGIASYVRATPQPRIIVYETIDSTNKLAKSLAVEGALHGTCVAANMQTEGRGRLGRSFFSPPQSGIYLSIILRPEIDISKATLITTMASVATSTAISDVCGIETDIKWVNDLYFRDKKVCGILTEAVTNFETGKIDSIVVGIGINCAPPNCDLPDEIKDIYGFIPGGFSYSRNQLTAEVISRVMELCSSIEDGDYSFIEEYRRRSMIIGNKINIFKGGLNHDPIKATAIDIDKFGGLIVKYENGKTETLTSGEVSIRPVP